MKISYRKFYPGAIIVLITVFAFFPVFFKGRIPYPGDLLLAEYQPWRSYGFDGYAPGGIPNKAQYFDTLRQMYPWRTLTDTLLHRGILPLWNPYNFSGSPLAANSQSQVFFPPTILYAILPQHGAWTVLVILQVIVTMVLTYAFARIIGITAWGSLFTAVCYSLSLYMTVFLEYNIMGHFMYILPLSVLGIEFLFRNRRKTGFAAVTSSVYLAATAGHLQLFGGVILFMMVYAGFRYAEERRVKHPLIISCMGLAIGLGLAAIQLFATAELLSQAARSAYPLEFFTDNLLLKWHQLILAISPDFYGNPAVKNYLLPFSYPSKAVYFGILPLVLALYAVSRGMPRAARRFFVLTLILLVFLTDNPAARLFYGLNLPLVSASSPSNFQFMAVFCLSILSGFGFDRMTRRLRLPHLSFAAVTAILAASILIHKLWSWPFNLKQAGLSLMLIFTAWVALVALHFLRVRQTYVKFLVILFTAAELTYFFVKFNPFVPLTWIQPETEIGSWLKIHTPPDRVWGYGTAGIEANFASGIGFLSPDGYDPLYPKWYGQFIQSSKSGKIAVTFDRFSRSDAVIARGYGATDLADNPYRLKILSAMGVRYVLDRKENGSTERTFPGNAFTPVTTLGDWTVYRYLAALPRAYLVQDAQTYNSADEFSRKFFDPSFDPARTVLLDKMPAGFTAAAAASSDASIRSYAPSDVTIRTVSSADSILVLSDTYYPGWKASVDGKETDVYRVNLAFRGVTVPKGIHDVEFRYQPAWMKTAVAVTIASLFSAIILFKIL